MKRIGIVCYIYKVDAYKQLLSAKNFEFKVLPSSIPDTKQIHVFVEESDVTEVKRICEQIEQFYKI